MSVCSIKQCGVRRSKNLPTLSFHRFPENQSLKQKWLETIGEENINPLHKNWWVCSRHFEECFFNRTLNVIRLYDNAVPTILCKDMVPAKQPEQDTANYVQYNIKRPDKVTLFLNVPLPGKGVDDEQTLALVNQALSQYKEKLHNSSSRVDSADNVKSKVGLVCAQCSQFLQQARQFRDMVAASQCRLAGAQPTVQLDNTIAKADNATPRSEYMSDSETEQVQVDDDSNSYLEKKYKSENEEVIQDAQTSTQNVYVDGGDHLVQYIVEEDDETDLEEIEMAIQEETLNVALVRKRAHSTQDDKYTKCQEPVSKKSSVPSTKVKDKAPVSCDSGFVIKRPQYNGKQKKSR